jgi:hypothetical protein
MGLCVQASFQAPLLDTQVDNIIKYYSDSWEHCVIKYNVLREELSLKCSIKTLEQRLK